MLILYSFTDEEAKQETLAIRFANADNAKKFKDAFDNAVLKVTETEADRIEGKDEVAEKPKSKDDDPSEKMTQLTSDASHERASSSCQRQNPHKSDCVS